MKNWKSFPLLAFILLSATFYACKKNGAAAEDALTHVPGNASAAAAVNLQALLEKADMESVRNMEFFREMTQTSAESPNPASILLEPEKSGIQLTKKIYLATELDKNDPEVAVSYCLLSLADADAFSQRMAATKEAVEVRHGAKWLISNSGNELVAWNDRLAVFAYANGQQGNLPNKVASVLQTNGPGSLSNNKSASQALLQPHDITIWISTDALHGSTAANAGLRLLDLDENILQGNTILGYADFENGQVIAHADFQVSKGFGTDFLGRFFKHGAETDFSGIFPKANLVFATMGALDVKGIDQFLSERPQVKGFADFALNDLGLRREELVGMLGGDLLVAGFSHQDKTSFLAITNISNRGKALEFLEAAARQHKLEQLDKSYFKIVSPGHLQFSGTTNEDVGRLLLKDNLLFYSTDSEILENIQSGRLGKEELAVGGDLAPFRNQALAGWFMPGSMKDSAGSSLVLAYMDQLKFNINGQGADFVAITTEAGENSFHTILKGINEAFLQGKLGKQAPL